MKEIINTYLGALLITIVGSGAALFIVHIATTDTIAATFGGSETSYAPLRQSILK